MAKRIGALKYIEVSAKTGENVRELFEYAALKAVDPRKKRQTCKML
jgi:translation initiation factor IF-2